MKKIIISLLGVLALLSSCTNEEAVKHKGPLPADYLITGCYFINEDSTGYKRVYSSDHQLYYINPAPIVSINQFKDVLMTNQQGFMLNIYLDAKGDSIFSAVTEKSIGKRLAFVVDNTLMMAPKVTGKITGGSVLINGGFTEEQMLEHYRSIKSSLDQSRDANGIQ